MFREKSRAAFGLSGRPAARKRDRASEPMRGAKLEWAEHH